MIFRAIIREHFHSLPRRSFREHLPRLFEDAHFHEAELALFDVKAVAPEPGHLCTSAALMRLALRILRHGNVEFYTFNMLAHKNVCHVRSFEPRGLFGMSSE